MRWILLWTTVISLYAILIACSGANYDSSVYTINTTTDETGHAQVQIDGKKIDVEVQQSYDKRPVSGYSLYASKYNDKLFIAGISSNIYNPLTSEVNALDENILEWAPIFQIINFLDSTHIVAKTAPIVASGKILNAAYSIYDYFSDEDRPKDWEYIFSPENNIRKLCVIGDINDVYKPIKFIAEASSVVFVARESIANYAAGYRLKALSLQLAGDSSNKADLIQWAVEKILSITTRTKVGDDLFTKEYKWCFVSAINPFEDFKSIANLHPVAYILVNIQAMEPDTYDPEDPWEGDWIGRIEEQDGFIDEINLTILRNGTYLEVKGGIHSRNDKSDLFIQGSGSGNITDQLRGLFYGSVDCFDAVGNINNYTINSCGDLYYQNVNLNGNMFFLNGKPMLYVNFDDKMKNMLGVDHVFMSKVWP